MSKEILQQVKAAEDRIGQLQEQVKSDKDKIDRLAKQELDNYRQELQRSLDRLEADLKAEEAEAVDQSVAELSQDTQTYRETIFHKYDQLKADLINQGVKEVMETYGNFSHEESSDYR